MNPTALLALMKNPDNPSFEQAIQQLGNLNPAEIPPEELPGFLAQIEATIATLKRSKEELEQQLEGLRTRAVALQSYKARS